MNTAVRVLPATERKAEDHSFVGITPSASTLFQGWGPRL